MKELVILIMLCTFLISCKNKPQVIVMSFPQIVKEDNQQENETFSSSKGMMKMAYHVYGRIESPEFMKELPSQFIVLVDNVRKPTNFYSADEDKAWEFSKTVDMHYMPYEYNINWDSLTLDNKVDTVLKIREQFKEKAMQLHAINNQQQQQVWIINNTKDTTSIFVRENWLLCILQAKNKDNVWRPIEYWIGFSCGSGTPVLLEKQLLPKTATSFVTTIESKGDYSTKLRYQLYGKDTIYYSNEFKGTIDYNQFTMDSSSIVDFRRNGCYVDIPRALNPYFRKKIMK